MAQYRLERITAVQGKQRFDKLLINDMAPFDVFEQNLEEADRKDLHKIYSYMDDVANHLLLPKTKHKDITPKKERVKEYEFKSGKLRVYAIAQAYGRIIVLGGYKNKQKKDILKFRSIKKRYLNSLESDNQ